MNQAIADDEPGAFDAAEQLLARVTDLQAVSPQPTAIPDEAMLAFHEVLGRWSLHRGRAGVAVENLERLFTLETDPIARAFTQSDLSHAYWMLDNANAARAAYRQAVALLAEGNAEAAFVAKIHVDQASRRIDRNEFAAAVPLLDSALESAHVSQGDDVGIVQGYRAVALAGSGAFDDSMVALDDVRQRMDESYVEMVLDQVAAAKRLAIRKQPLAPPGAPYAGLDLSTFWRHSKYADDTYLDDPLTDELLADVETRLGHRLPHAYVALVRQSQNGGMPQRTCHPTKTPTSWSNDHAAIASIAAIGVTSEYALCGEKGHAFWVDMWGYPPIGIYFGGCPSAGHDLFCLDYRKCGPRGEPAVVHVDQARDYAITPIAPSFEVFIYGLEAG